MTIEYRCDTCRADDANDACFGKCHDKAEMIDKVVKLVEVMNAKKDGHKWQVKRIENWPAS